MMVRVALTALIVVAPPYCGRGPLRAFVPTIGMSLEAPWHLPAWV